MNFEDLSKLGYSYDPKTNIATRLQPISKQTKRKALGGAKESSGQSTTPSKDLHKLTKPIRITLERYAVRPIDPDNLAGGCKALIDALRYEGIIPDDNPQTIELVIRSLKCGPKDKERIEVTLDY